MSRQDLLPLLSKDSVIIDGDGQRYVIEKGIGKGGAGMVYTAQSDVGRVAVKVTRTLGHACDLIDELRWAGCDHNRFIAGIIAFGSISLPGLTDVPIPFLVMPYFTKGSIRTHFKHELRKNKLLPKHNMVARWLIQTCRALDSLNIVHRDIKPENILLDDKLNAYLSDFGLAVPAKPADRQKSGIVLSQEPSGTPDYMSPEQYAGATDLDIRSDIFSLGLLIYELMTGIDARNCGMKDIDSLRQDFQKYGFRPDMTVIADPSWRTIASKCTELKRSQRYQSYGDLIRDVDALLTDQDRKDIDESQSPHIMALLHEAGPLS